MQKHETIQKISTENVIEILRNGDLLAKTLISTADLGGWERFVNRITSAANGRQRIIEDPFEARVKMGAQVIREIVFINNNVSYYDNFDHRFTRVKYSFGFRNGNLVELEKTIKRKIQIQIEQNKLANEQSSIDQVELFLKRVELELNQDVTGRQILLVPTYKKLIDENRYTYKYNPKILLWSRRTRDNDAQRRENKYYTKKTSVSLLPTDGIMQLFKPTPARNQTVALLFDLTKCDLRDEKYIFPEEAHTAVQWWKNKDTFFQYAWRNSKNNSANSNQQLHSIPIEQLKRTLAEQRQLGIIPNHNNLFIGISLESVIGLLVTQNNLNERLNGIYRKEFLRCRLLKDVPIFIQDQDKDFIEYTDQMQREDIEKARYIENVQAGIFLKLILSLDERYRRSDIYTIDLSYFFEKRFEERLEEGNEELYKNKIKAYQQDLYEYIAKSDNVENIKILIEHLLKSTQREYIELNTINSLLNFICQKKQERLIPIIELILEQYKPDVRPIIAALESLLEFMCGTHLECLFPLIQLIIKQYQPEIRPMRQQLYNYVWYDDYDDERTYFHYIENWTVLITMLLHFDRTKTIDMIISYYPEQITSILTTLKSMEVEINKVKKTYPYIKPFYKAGEIQIAYANLLVKLPADISVQVTEYDENILKAYFMQKIHVAPNDDFLDRITLEIQQCHLLNQFRPQPTRFDRLAMMFFNNNEEPNVKKDLIEAIQNQRVVIKENSKGNAEYNFEL